MGLAIFQCVYPLKLLMLETVLFILNQGHMIVLGITHVLKLKCKFDKRTF